MQLTNLQPTHLRTPHSQASRPALTPLAAALHRKLAKAKLQLAQTRAKLAEKREALLRMGLADGGAPDPAQGLGRYGASASAPRMALLEAKGGRRQRAALKVSVQLMHFTYLSVCVY